MDKIEEVKIEDKITKELLIDEVLENNEIRQQLALKLNNVAKDMQLRPGNDKSTQTDAKLNLIKTIDDLLKSKESAVTTVLKLKLDEDANENVKAMNAAILDSIIEKFAGKGFANATGTNETKLEDIESDLDAELEAQLETPITEGEIKDYDSYSQDDDIPEIKELLSENPTA